MQSQPLNEEHLSEWNVERKLSNFPFLLSNLKVLSYYLLTWQNRWKKKKLMKIPSTHKITMVLRSFCQSRAQHGWSLSFQVACFHRNTEQYRLELSSRNTCSKQVSLDEFAQVVTQQALKTAKILESSRQPVLVYNNTYGKKTTSDEFPIFQFLSFANHPVIAHH